MVHALQAGGHEVDRKLDNAEIQLFSHTQPVSGMAQSGYPSDSEEEDLELEEGMYWNFCENHA